MFRSVFLRNILLVVVAAVAFLPFYTTAILYPAFTRAAALEAEEEAIRVASHIASSLLDPVGVVSRQSLPPGLARGVLSIVRDFGIQKIKIFSREGEILFSTEPLEVGTWNDKSYFRDIVAQGQPYTKIVRKDTLSLEDRRVTRDVVETYVPIMHQDGFAGAFEIYYDITPRWERVNRLITHSSLLVLGVTLALSLAALVSARQASRSFAARDAAEAELRRSRAQLEELVEARTVELTAANERLCREVEEKERMQVELRNLSAHLQQVREDERTRIAREAHDRLGQALTALKMGVVWVEKRLPAAETALLEKTRSMAAIIDDTVQTVRRLCSELRPGILDDLGLVAALRWQAEDFQRITEIRATVEAVPEDPALGDDVATTIFRVVQELLTNVARHAGAKSVHIELAANDEGVTVTVRDDGRGIQPEELANPRSLGLIGIRERVRALSGSIRIQGLPGQGTTVTVTLPQPDPGGELPA
ncbi:MAG: sensor histidine kinase [Thermodesulfobacteriota bacterium]